MTATERTEDALAILPQIEAGECVHGGDPHTCPPCHARRKPAGLTGTGRTTAPFTAKFDGWCGCGLPIHVGQRCAKWSDGRTRHVGCTP